METQPTAPSAAAEELKGAEPKQVGAATANYQTSSEDQAAAPRIYNAPLDPRYPGFFRLPGTRSFLKIGYFKTDFIYDLKPPGNTESFVPSSFPLPQPASVNTSTISIRPTRLSLDFRVPTEMFEDVRLYLEGDLFGTNSTTPRLRHAYVQVKNILIGQTFSVFMDPDAGPDQLEFQGPNAEVFIRSPQFRYTLRAGEQNSFSFSVERPTSDVSVPLTLARYRTVQPRTGRSTFVTMRTEAMSKFRESCGLWRTTCPTGCMTLLSVGELAVRARSISLSKTP
jgi:DcaP outer membrane protein